MKDVSWDLLTRVGRRNAYQDIALGLASGKITIAKAKLLAELIRGVEKSIPRRHPPTKVELAIVRETEKAKTLGRLEGKAEANGSYLGSRQTSAMAGAVKKVDLQEQGRAKPPLPPVVSVDGAGPFGVFADTKPNGRTSPSQRRDAIAGPSDDPWGEE